MLCISKTFQFTRLALFKDMQAFCHQKMRDHIPSIHSHGGNNLKSVELTAESLADADVVVITTNHKAYDVDFITKNAQLIVDLRNVIPAAGDHVYKL